MQFVDKRHGWISAELDGDPKTFRDDPHPWAVEQTVNGGRSWRISRLPGCGCDPGMLSFYDARHGYVLAADRFGRGNPRLFWTDNGGASWQLVARPPHFGPITFVDHRNGFLGTYVSATIGGPGTGGRGWPAVLYRTTDGGKTWSKDRVPPPSYGLVLPIRSFGRRLVVADWKKGNHPRIYASGDAGTHWTAFIPPNPAKTPGIQFAAGSPTMWAFPTRNSLYVTRDGGQSWDRIIPRGLPRPFEIRQLVFSSPLVGWMVVGRDEALYRTTDGGRHWTPSACARHRLACPAGS